MASKYDGLARIIIQNIGGRENIISLEHCMTRLRFVLQDESKANTEMLKKTDGVKGALISGGQYQIIIGTHVEEIYNAVNHIAQLSNVTKSASEETKEAEMKGKTSLIDIITGIFMPALGLLTACGIIKGLLVVFTQFNLLSSTDGTYILLNSIGDVIFYFMPVFLGYTSAKKFKCSEVVGMAIGACLIYPDIISAINGDTISTLFSGTVLQSNVYITFLKIPVILNNYSSTLIPVILSVWLGAKVEKTAKKHCPSVIKFFGVPLITLLITVPLAFLIIGPIATWITNIVAAITMAIFNLSPLLFGLFIGGFWQIFVIFGIHGGIVPIVINNLATKGYDVVFAATLAGCFTQLASLAAILIRTKDKTIRDTALPALFSAIFGISEPAIYGVTLPLKKPFVICCIASAIGGAIAIVGGTRYYNMGGQGIFSFLCYMNPDGSCVSLVWSVIAVLIAMLLAFLGTIFIYHDKKENA